MRPNEKEGTESSLRLSVNALTGDGKRRHYCFPELTANVRRVNVFSAKPLQTLAKQYDYDALSHT